MNQERSLTISYASHPRVALLRDRFRYALEDIALGFDRWEESRVHGPGLYVALVVGPAIDAYADPMGDNRWPSDAPRDAVEACDAFADALEHVAYTADGAVVVSVDGMVSDRLVRFRSLDRPDRVPYARWMGSRHMSALDISTRADVIATLTISQESGRVTVFADGSFESDTLDTLGAPYRTDCGTADS